MTTTEKIPSKTTTTSAISTTQLYEHWQGHRGLTRRTIEAFAEDQVFTFSIGGMRPFGELVKELLAMAEPGLRGVVTGKWVKFEETPAYTSHGQPKSKQDLLNAWDEASKAMDELWPQLPPARLQEVDTAFGQWKGTGLSFILYFIDNEIHHRAQGYVYLRALGIEPPPFWDRQNWA